MTLGRCPLSIFYSRGTPPRDSGLDCLVCAMFAGQPDGDVERAFSQLQEEDLEQDLVSGDYSDANQERDQLRRTNRQLRVSEGGSLRAVHLSRHKWPGGIVN